MGRKQTLAASAWGSPAALSTMGDSDHSTNRGNSLDIGVFFRLKLFPEHVWIELFNRQGRAYFGADASKRFDQRRFAIHVGSASIEQHRSIRRQIAERLAHPIEGDRPAKQATAVPIGAAASVHHVWRVGDDQISARRNGLRPHGFDAD